MPSNFQFLQSNFPRLYREAIECEKLCFTSPKASVILARSVLENGVNWLYENDADLELPYDTSLGRLIHEQCFKEIIRPTLFREIELIRRNGNNGAHGKLVKQDVSLATLKCLFSFLSFVAVYYAEEEPNIPPFDIQLIPDEEQQKESLREIEILKRQLEIARQKEKEEREKREAKEADLETYKQEQAQQQKATTQRREKREKVKTPETSIPHLLSEAQTRKYYIDALLQDAGWSDMQEGRDLEFEVVGMPRSTNPSGKGYVDYVLWGANGKPLAVVEAKKTLVEARVGKHQAELYADCMQKMYGQRPIIFYTNGFDTHLWDDTFCNERPIDGFYTQDELQLLIDRRNTRKDLRQYQVLPHITNRDYQIEAIQRVAENMCATNKAGKLINTNRASLLVMATGSGKTRTAASIVDMLSKSNWAKRVLFLADRNALVSQAKKAFNELLPELSSINLTQEKEDNSTRLVFSTYPTILNKIDAIKNEDERFYGIGHFDLIIIDEAHRSVYQKYRAIFEYFDAMLVGLTATPKADVDHNTYGLFGIEEHDPTFAYELDKAVEEGYLVPAKAISVPLKFQREGIAYSDLSDEEKREYEEQFGDPSNDEAPDTIGSSALNKWLFNTDTVDKVLHFLMEKGIKVEGGDKLGKTIIFAKNHSHAVFIEERFNKNYPEYSGKFLRVIDNYETKAQDLLEQFVDEYQEQEPQIAVSVDMMDTGVDAPRVVNLVFFKPVKSVSKYWQMIGRGTRLCPNLFAPGCDKKEFVIFDFCENFEFFEEHPNGFEGNASKPITQQCFEAKLRVAQLIQEFGGKTDEDLSIRTQYLNELHQIIAGLDRERFVVRKQLRYVDEYAKKKRLENLSKSDIQEIDDHLSHLQKPVKGDDELARRFDILLLNLQIMHLTGTGNAQQTIYKIAGIATALSKKDNIPQIKNALPLIKEINQEQFWENITIKAMENVRSSLRDLIKYLDTQNQEPVYTHFADTLNVDVVVEKDILKGYSNLKSYKDRVESYIRQNKTHITIHKLSHNIPITKKELDELERILFTEDVAESKETFVAKYGEKPLGAFVRSITGLDQKAVQEAFSDFLQHGQLTADQMTFLNNIMAFITKNGVFDKSMLMESPFTDLDDQGIIGVFGKRASMIVKLIDEINGNCEIA